jgi:hypothetical protein
MDTLAAFLAVVTGLLVRLAFPIIGTLILIYLLRKLDEHWQTEAERLPLAAKKVECWNIKGCSEEQRKRCPGATSSLPCWQAYRRPNGYLQEKCISCDVFINAPIPTLKVEPRRM